MGLSLGLQAQVLPNNPSAPVLPPTPGILQDTLTARKLSPGRKFEYRVIQQFGIRGVLGSAVGAAIAQGFNTPEAWGSHWDGYGKRYASAFGLAMTRGVIE